MTYLVIPAAGASTRYNLDRPKFLLNHPLGGTMLSHAIKGLGNLESHGIQRVLIVSLEHYFEKISVEKLVQEISKFVDLPVEILLLSEPTNSMVATLVKAIEHIGTDSPLILKDCDNLVELRDGALKNDYNFITTLNLSEFPQVRADNKSFIKFNNKNILENIVEKKIISSHINVGCIKIRSSSDFLSSALELQGANETYVSDIIRSMLEQNKEFFAVPVTKYEDWGTREDWLKFTSEFSTIFVDIDGVMAMNENPLSLVGGWNRFRPIEDNCAVLLKMVETGKTKIVFTTARSDEYREECESKLNELGFKNVVLVMNLLHAKRILINDFAKTNPYPTAIAINIERDKDNLTDYLS